MTRAISRMRLAFSGESLRELTTSQDDSSTKTKFHGASGSEGEELAQGLLW